MKHILFVFICLVVCSGCSPRYPKISPLDRTLGVDFRLYGRKHTGLIQAFEFQNEIHVQFVEHKDSGFSPRILSLTGETIKPISYEGHYLSLPVELQAFLVSFNNQKTLVCREEACDRINKKEVLTQS